AEGGAGVGDLPGPAAERADHQHVADRGASVVLERRGVIDVHDRGVGQRGGGDGADLGPQRGRVGGAAGQHAGRGGAHRGGAVVGRRRAAEEEAINAVEEGRRVLGQQEGAEYVAGGAGGQGVDDVVGRGRAGVDVERQRAAGAAEAGGVGRV